MAALTAVPAWNWALSLFRNARLDMPGRYYLVQGKRMHLYCSGAGSPTIVIEAGLGSDWLGWQVVQPELSKLTRVCTYDRSGLGWSERRSGSRDAESIAQQLHALLDIAGVQRPIVLAGHSAGGLYVREFAREFPTEVDALVLVDSSSPKQIDELPRFRDSYEQAKRHAARNLWLDRLSVWSGWARLIGECRETPGKGLQRLASFYEAKACRPEYVDGELGEYLDFETSARQAGRLQSVGRKPVLILSRDPKSADKSDMGEVIHNREQEELKSLSPLSWRVIALNSGHKIFQDRPDVVTNEMSRLIRFIRGGAAPPFGLTRSE